MYNKLCRLFEIHDNILQIQPHLHHSLFQLRKRFIRISFTLFPLYGRTERKTQRIDNVLWPFFAKISGENESGYKFWPIYGSSRKEGVYRKKFFLWPIFFSESLKLDSENPQEVRAAWPLYVSKESPEKTSQTFLWPLLNFLPHLWP